MVPVLRTVFDHRSERSCTKRRSVKQNSFQVSQRVTCVATKLRDKLQEILPSVTEALE